MAEFPSLPLFTDAYMADTRHLTAAQHGAYLLLLMTAWRMPDCRLPNDDRFLARCAAMDLRTWKANKEVVLSFWKLDDEQKFRQHRLLDERKYVDDMRRKNSEAGKASALKRLNRCSTNVQPKSNENPTPIPIPITEGTSVPSAEPPPVDFKKAIFQEGLRYVAQATSKPPDKLRPLFGKWCRDYGDALVASVLVQAQQFSPVDLIPFLEKTLKEKHNANSQPNNWQSPRGNKTERLKAAAYRAAEAGGFAPKPGGEARVDDHPLSLFPSPETVR